MAFAKAIQNIDPEAYEKYLLALFQYKKSCSEYARIRKRYKYSSVIQEKMLYYLARESYSAECKKYFVARSEWERVLVQHKLTERIKEPSMQEVARMLGISVPVSTKELIEDSKKAAIAQSFKPGEIERLRSEIEARNRKNVKEGFLSSKDMKVDETAGDFEPLP